MIDAIKTQPQTIPNRKSNARYRNIKYSGYMAAGLGIACGITGIKKVKLPHKFTIHKICALFAGISALWHIAAIKRWDEKLANSLYSKF